MTSSSGASGPTPWTCTVPVTTARSDAKPSIQAIAAARRDARALELPLGRVHALDAARVDVDQPDPRVVPRALGGIVRADRRDLAAGPAELEDVDALGLHLARRARLGVDEVEAPPVLRRPEDLRVLLLRAGLLDLRRRLRAGAVGAEVGGEDEQRARRPGDHWMSSTEPGISPSSPRLVDPDAHAARRGRDRTRTRASPSGEKRGSASAAPGLGDAARRRSRAASRTALPFSRKTGRDDVREALSVRREAQIERAAAAAGAARA